ncbi:MAG: hypothetical protein GY906_23635 [bacterium]|nr:hypothetical protein [bacterium]
MAVTYRPIQMSAEIVDRLNEFKERVSNELYQSPHALGLGASIGVALDLLEWVDKFDRAPPIEALREIAEHYPRRGRPRVSAPSEESYVKKPVRGAPDDRGHEFEVCDAQRNTRQCKVCRLVVEEHDDLFPRCTGSGGEEASAS